MLYTDIIIEYKRILTKQDVTDPDNLIDLEDYKSNIVFDIHEKIPNEEKYDVAVNNMNVKQYTHFNHKKNTIVRIFRQVPLGRIPIMLHSNICSLVNQDEETLRLMGECPYGPGGYFIINGKEKVIVAQERQMENKLFNNNQPSDSVYQFTQEIRSTPENRADPARITKLHMYKQRKLSNARYLSILYRTNPENSFIYVGDYVELRSYSKKEGNEFRVESIINGVYTLDDRSTKTNQELEYIPVESLNENGKKYSEKSSDNECLFGMSISKKK